MAQQQQQQQQSHQHRRQRAAQKPRNQQQQHQGKQGKEEAPKRQQPQPPTCRQAEEKTKARKRLQAESQPELAVKTRTPELEARKEELLEMLFFFFLHRMLPWSNYLVIFLTRRFKEWDPELLREVADAYPELFYILVKEAPSSAEGRSPPKQGKQKFQVMLKGVPTPSFVDANAADASLDSAGLRVAFQKFVERLKKPEEWHSWAGQTDQELALAELLLALFPQITLGEMRLLVKEAVRRKVIGRKTFGEGRDRKDFLVPYEESDMFKKKMEQLAAAQIVAFETHLGPLSKVVVRNTFLDVVEVPVQVLRRRASVPAMMC